MERGGLLSRSERSYIPLEDLDSPPQSGQRYSHTEPSPSFPLRPGMDEITSPELGRSTSPDLTKEVLEYRGRPLSRQSMTPSTMSRTHIHRYTWWFEFLSLVTSAAAIVATFAILRLFDRKPIPHWATAGSGLSLNSILSVFSTMSRASLLVPIDRSIGQLYWLAIARRGRRLAEAEMYNQASRGPHGAIRLLWKRRGIGLTSMGCFLTITSVALGFAQQQLILYPTHTIKTVDPENLTMIGRSLYTYDTFQETSLTSQAAPVPAVEFAVASSVFASLNHFVVHDPLYRCDSGNCDYPRFTTLGICSHCHDTKDEITSACDTDQNHCWANYRDLIGNAWERSNDTAFSTVINQTINTESVSIVETFTLNVSMVTWPPTYAAWSCEIMWCVRSVNATVKNSTFTETQLDEHTEATLQPDGSALFQYIEPDKQVTNFTVTRSAQRAFKALGSTLAGWSRKTQTGQWVHSSPLFGGMAAFATADMTVGGSHRHRHKANPIDVMADGMSNAIRNSLSVPGWRVERHTIVQVRWWWMVYPAAIWILTAVFTWAVAWSTMTRDTSVGAWGCSSIALLLWGVDDDIRERVGDWNSERMEAKARDIIVKLEKDENGNGWRMKEVRGSALGA